MTMAKILYVDGDSRRGRLVADMLTGRGHFVIVTGSAERAMLHVEHEADYDAVVLHLVLPGIDGAELCRWLQRWSSLPSTPRIVFSSPGTELRIDLRKKLPRWLPADLYLHDVTDPARLVEAVEDVLRARRSEVGEEPAGPTRSDG